MNNQRLLVWAAFGLLAFMTYQTWLQDYGAKPQGPAQTTSAPASPLEPANEDALPTLPEDEGETPTLTAEGQPTPDLPTTENRGEIIRVTTDVMDIDINTAGGRLQKAVLTNYPVAKDRPDDLVHLLSKDESRFGYIHAGLIGEERESGAYFNATLQSARKAFEMNGNDELIVPLTWDSGDGIRIEKRLRFSRGSYRIDVEHRVVNDSDSGWRAAEYTVLKQRSVPVERSMFNVDTYSFDGAIVYNGSKSEKLDLGDLQDGPYQINASGGWLGGIQHHFLRVIVPATEGEYRLGVKLKNEVSESSVFGSAITIPAGGEHTFHTTLFVGPKLQQELEEITPSL